MPHANLAMSTSWHVETALSSDLGPIVVNICTETLSVASDKRTFENFNKADWMSYRDFFEDGIKFLSAENVPNMEQALKRLLQKAMKKHIPRGRIPRILPGFPREAAKLAMEREQLRKQNMSAKWIAELRYQASGEPTSARKWTKHLDECDLRKGCKKLWNTIEGLAKKEERHNNIALKFSADSKATFGAKACVNRFNQMYFPADPCKKEKGHRAVMRKFSKASSEFRLLNVEVQQAIARARNSKALGPDQLAPLMLKKLGPLAVAYIKMFNCSLAANMTIPSIWNKSRVIPLLKAGKSPKEAMSYRPISLLSPMIKLMETALLPTVMDGAVYAEHQHGFRKGRSTTSALCEIDEHIRAEDTGGWNHNGCSRSPCGF